MPFPTQFPREQMQHVVEYLIGASHRRTRDLIQDCYEILGYGLHVGLPVDFDETSAVLATPPESVDDCAAILQAAIADSRAYAIQPPAVPWQLILPIMARLLEELFQRWVAGQ